MHSIVLCVQMSFAYWTLSLDNTSLKKTISVLVPRLYIYLYQLSPPRLYDISIPSIPPAPCAWLLG